MNSPGAHYASYLMFISYANLTKGRETLRPKWRASEVDLSGKQLGG